MAQIYDGIARQKIDQLKQDDSLLRSELSGQRVDRQVEISRLEGRIIRLEEQLRSMSHPSSTGQLAMVLALLNESPARDLQQPESILDQDAVDEAEGSQPSVNSDLPLEERKAMVRELVGRDYLSSLEVEIADARVGLLEQTRELSSLQRLSAKGLASSGQVELTSLRLQRSELQLKRLERQRSSIQRLFPQLVDEATSKVTSAQPTEELPESKSSPAPK